MRSLFFKEKTRLQRLSKLLNEIHKLEKQHLRLKRKSFKFKFLQLVYPREMDGNGFRGRLIVPPQDYDRFNAMCVCNKPGCGPEHNHLPLLYDHDPQKLIGAVRLDFVPPPASSHEECKHFEKYWWVATVTLVFAARPAKGIFATIEQGGQSAIRELSIGYDVVKHPSYHTGRGRRIWEVSIVKDYRRYELQKLHCRECEFFEDEVCKAKSQCGS